MDMNICDLKRGDHAVVLKVELDDELRARLGSLRVYTGAKITLLKVSFRKRVWLVQAGSGKIAFDRETAEGVRVWRI